jgi:type IV pilus assembly protein PilQ
MESVKKAHYHKRIPLVVIFLVVGVLAGCAPQKAQPPSEMDYWREMALRNRGYSPQARQRDLDLPEKKIETVSPGTERQLQRPLPKSRITLKMHQTDVAVLLRALSRAVDLNIMINESVKGRISINVKDAEWDQVFLGILNSQGLTHEWEGDILRIVNFEDREQRLRNLEADEKILSRTRALEMQAPLVTKIIPIDFASAENLRASVEKMLSAKQPGEPTGSVMVDSHTNALIVQATPYDIQSIVRMIVELDRPTQQILIEAHIVETTSRTARELGVQWGGLYFNSAQNYWVTPSAMNALGNVAPGTGGQVDPGAGTGINFPANLGNALQAGTGMTLGIIGQNSNGILALQLSALEEEGKLNILSSPSITTLDNLKAIIQSGDQVPIPVVENENVEIVYKSALLSLEVTPHVIQDNALKLDIVTTKDELDFSRPIQNYPTIVSKKAATNVILYDGQTTVIGGLKKNTSQNREAGVPWARKIPLLGNLFQNQGKRDQMEEILIFITPYILKSRPEDPAAPQNGAIAPAPGTQP